MPEWLADFLFAPLPFILWAIVLPVVLIADCVYRGTGGKDPQ